MSHLPGQPDVEEAPGKSPVSGRTDAARGAERTNPDDVWPKLGKNVVDRLKRHELPGDSLVSLRFAAKTNFSAFIFLPSMLLTILGESVVLNFETAAVLDSKGKPSCVWGNVAEDFFTGRKYCPAIAGFSPWTWSVGWYGTFIITCAFAYYKGRGIRARCPSSPDRDSSAFCYFLDCTRARYTDRHLLAWFILVTLCFFNSIGIRLVSTSHGKDISNACVRYGDWAGHMDYCQPAGLLEPSWTIILFGLYTFYSAALMDQGTVGWRAKNEQEMIMDPVLAAAVKLKALVRKQMQQSREKQLNTHSVLDKFVLKPFCLCKLFCLRVGQSAAALVRACQTGEGDEKAEPDSTSEDEASEESPWDFCETFQQDVEDIFKNALAFEHWQKHETTLFYAQDALMCERANVRLRMRAGTIPAGEDPLLKRLDQIENSVKTWSGQRKPIEIMEEYKFCTYLKGIKNGALVRSRTQGGHCVGIGPIVIGFFLGLMWFYLFTFTPQGDSYAWIYAWLYYGEDIERVVQYRCTATNSTAKPSPWCDATDYLLISRTTLWVSHQMLSVRYNEIGVVVAAASKALILGMCGGMWAINVSKTLTGLQQATHPMHILDAILAWWARAGNTSTCHVHVWKLARDSILHSDVKNILARYEKVVLGYVGFAFWLMTDSTVQIAILNNPPNVMALYFLVLMCGCTLLCLYQATEVHYSQLRHIQTLQRLKESTYVYGERPDLIHQRDLIDQMITRMSNGGDYQTRLLYIPLNPTFQKAVGVYFFTACVSVVTRLSLGGGNIERSLGAFETLANATAQN